MTNQQGAPEALRLADLFELERDPESLYRLAAAELRRLHAENERLAALVEAQQPAPSAAADWKLVPEGPTPDMVRAGWELLPSATGDRWDAGAVLARSIYSAMLAAAPQPSPTPQADSQPAPVLDESAARDECKRKWLAEDEDCNLLEAYDRGWKDRAARAPADSVTAPAEPDKADPRKLQLQGLILALARLSCVPPMSPALEHQLERLAAFYFDNGDEKFAQKLVLLKRGAFANGRRSVLAPSATATPPAQAAGSAREDADPLQGAANWLAEAHGQFCVAVLQGCLMIGYNRAKRLHDAAIAARKKGGV